MNSGGAPNQPSAYDQMMGQIQAEAQTAPTVYSSEAQFNPQFNALTVNDLNDLLYGTPAGTQNVPTTNTIQGWKNTQTGQVSPTAPSGYVANAADTGIAAWGTASPTSTTPFNGWVPYTYQVPGTTTTTTTGSPGILSLLGSAGNTLAAQQGQQLGIQQAAGISNLAANGPAATNAALAVDPAESGLLNSLTSQATDQLNAGESLDPAQSELANQTVLQGEAQRGMGYGPTDIYNQALNVSQYAQNLRSQRQTFASGVAGLRAGILQNYTNPIFNQGLQTNPYSALQSGLTINTGSAPTFGSTINPQQIAAANQNAAATNAAANANSSAALASAGISGLSSLGSAGLGALGAGAGTAALGSILGSGAVGAGISGAIPALADLLMI